MIHPLTPDLTALKDEELHHKHGDLQKRLVQAHRFGPTYVIPQLQMLLQDYQAEIQRRNAKLMDEIQKKTAATGKNFKGIIDIQ